MIRPPPSSTLFPYTTLSRSVLALLVARRQHQHLLVGQLQLGEQVGERLRLRLLIGERVHHQHRALAGARVERGLLRQLPDRKSTRLNSSHLVISYAVFSLKK